LISFLFMLCAVPCKCPLSSILSPSSSFPTLCECLCEFYDYALDHIGCSSMELRVFAVFSRCSHLHASFVGLARTVNTHRIFGDFPANICVIKPYIYIWFWPATLICWFIHAKQSIHTKHLRPYTQNSLVPLHLHVIRHQL
jgi:hypothetical protein